MDTKQAVQEANAAARHYLRLAKPWMKTGGIWLGTGAVLGLFFTDWQLVLGYVPFIKDKFGHETPK